LLYEEVTKADSVLLGEPIKVVELLHDLNGIEVEV
jgi:hypothetical protein